MSDAAERARRDFADALGRDNQLKSAHLIRAFAEVRREAFLGPGPWLILPDDAGYRSTPDADPRHLYADMAVALDVTRTLNNGAPGFLARALDVLAPAPGETVLHIGCATGYYSAILAEVVGSGGRVIAVELDPTLCETARRTLRHWRQVEVRHADGIAQPEDEKVDAIWVHAGVTHPQTRWLDALPIGGRISFPLTAIRPPGRIRRIVRDHAGSVLHLARTADGWSARFGERCAVQALLGGRDPSLQRTLKAAYEDAHMDAVRSLQQDVHEPGRDCWAHMPGYCLSRRGVGEET